jgi:N-acyl-D-aspartate/D-glutamate deacylase
MEIWIFVVKSNFEILEGTTLFGLNVGTCKAQDIKETAREKSSPLAQFDNSQLVLWKAAGKKTCKDVLEVLKNDRNAVKEIDGNEQVVDLGLSDGEILLIQIPSTSHISTVTEAFSDNLVDQSIHDHPATTIVDESKDQVRKLREFASMFKPLYLIEYR